MCLFLSAAAVRTTTGELPAATAVQMRQMETPTSAGITAVKSTTNQTWTTAAGTGPTVSYDMPAWTTDGRCCLAYTVCLCYIRYVNILQNRTLSKLAAVYVKSIGVLLDGSLVPSRGDGAT